MAKKPTKFEKFKSWLLRKKEFRYKDVDAAFGRYCQSEHIYLNSLRRHGIVKKASRGHYFVADLKHLKGITTGDLHAKSQVQVLRRKLKESREDFWKQFRETMTIRHELEKLKKEKNDEQANGVHTEHANNT